LDHQVTHKRKVSDGEITVTYFKAEFFRYRLRVGSAVFARGRPRKFDESRVLNTATSLFLRGGYEAVGVSAVCKEAGIPVQSLYNVFGDKKAFYQRVLNHFGETMSEPMVEKLNSTDCPLAALREFVEGWRCQMGKGALGGCLFAQCYAVGSNLGADCPEEIAHHFSTRLRRALAKTAERASLMGLLPQETDPKALADMLFTLSFGVAVMGRSGLPKSIIERSIKQALTLLQEGLS
jgi:TetR/AcrR family transcriptional repressor of nem operon